MKRYYNKTDHLIPYVCTDYKDYVVINSMRPSDYFPNKPWKSKHYAGFAIDFNVVAIFRRKDFDKLTAV